VCCHQANQKNLHLECAKYSSFQEERNPTKKKQKLFLNRWEIVVTSDRTSEKISGKQRMLPALRSTEL